MQCSTVYYSALVQYSILQWSTHEADTIVAGTLALGASDKLHSTAQHVLRLNSTLYFILKYTIYFY